MHIGLIGGIGPAATEFYYRGLVRAHAAVERRMELTIAHADIGELLANLTAGDQAAQARAFLPLAERLNAAGADAVAITSMAGHFCINAFEALSPLPVINAIPELDAEIVRRGLGRIGLLGTRTVMESRVYGGIPSVDVVLPSGADLAAAHDAYIAMATAGKATEAQRTRLFALGAALHEDQGAEAVVLAGTDLFLAFDGRDPGFPVIDSAQAHVEAIFRRATGS